jgi:signal transduction histidine kinase
LRLDATEAGRLGLPAADVIAAFAPIRMQGGRSWGVATLTSLSVLRAHEELILWRFGSIALAVVMLVGLFGTYAVVVWRRASLLQERLRHSDEVARLHENAKRILASMPTGILVLGGDGRISEANEALSARAGWALAGGDLAQAFPGAGAGELEQIRALVRTAVAEQRPARLLSAPLGLFKEPGHYSIHAVPLAEAQVLVVVDDLTDVHRLESELLRIEKLRTVGVLAAGIAHEIGTPLGVMRSRAELVLEKLGSAHPQSRGIGIIIEQADRVTRTIRELLDFSRVQPAEAAPVPIAAIVRRSVELLRYELERRRLVVSTAGLDELPPLAADPDQLQQVLVNLLMNAIDASPAGGEIAVSARRDADSPEVVRLAVADEGHGIPAEDLLRVFDPFFTTKKRGQGTGLGLTVVMQIVRNHDARIELSSRPGQGTLVTLRWPVSALARGARRAG